MLSQRKLFEKIDVKILLKSQSCISLDRVQKEVSEKLFFSKKITYLCTAFESDKFLQFVN